ncbi:MAG: hypothetical protein SV487_02825, partial [Thermodesulfobacteriota bacterium]|nr:hypothetical protein [Thermodesulfobacteriota bacterium]
MKVSATLPKVAYVVLTFCMFSLIIAPAAMPSEAKAGVNARLTKILAPRPLAFEANQGQTGPAVKFLAQGPDYKMFFTPAEMVLTLRKSPLTKTVILRMRLEGATARAEVSGINPLPGKVNYFIGNDPKKWRLGVPAFAKVKYKSVYPGIDLVFYGRQGRMEYDFKVYPGGDPRSISLCFTGADKISLDQDGNLLLHTPGGVLTQSAPLAYQAADGRREKVSCNYTLLGKDRVCFKVGGYDPKK